MFDDKIIIMKRMLHQFLYVLLLLSSAEVCSQEKLLSNHLEPYATRFSISSNYEFGDSIKQLLSEEISKNNFVGLAELHQSRQLSFFTTALLKVLAKNGFEHFALELGPFSASILQNLSQVPKETEHKIKTLNKKYGNRLYNMTPLIFVDREEDAIFVEQASNLGYKFWGLDQEFIYSYEMHLDTIYSYEDSPANTLTQDYLNLKNKLSKWGKKAARSNFEYNCKLLEDPLTEKFFSNFENNTEAMVYIRALKTSWDIYCKSERGRGSNQQRANYMKQNFANYYKEFAASDTSPKVFVKLGSVHLTKETSPFGVEDMGRFLSESAKSTSTGFLNIRHLPRFRNGKDLKDKKLWSSVKLFMELGREKEWTLIDLRPMRKEIQNGQFQTTEKLAYEINNYDLLLIPPDDKKSKINF